MRLRTMLHTCRTFQFKISMRRVCTKTFLIGGVLGLVMPQELAASQTRMGDGAGVFDERFCDSAHVFVGTVSLEDVYRP